MLYLDTSALAKLVVSETESAMLQRYLAERGTHVVASSFLAHTELLRAARPLGSEVTKRARAVLDEVHLVDVTRLVLELAADLEVGERLRSLDAIHLATAVMLADRLDNVVTYDKRMLAAAEALGMAVEAPGAG